MICTFFGHRDCPEEIYPMLYDAIETLIRQKGVRCFYVGNQGRFDEMALKALRALIQVYPEIEYAVVLAYMPRKAHGMNPEETVFPEGFESFPPRFAISHRNRWMLERTDYVITHVKYGWGGAAQFAEKAKRAGKTVINIG